MIRKNDNLIRRPQRGFTLLEMMIVTGLMGFLTLLISGTWHAFGRSISDAVARCRVTQEANLALESLHRDLGGYLPGQSSGAAEENRMIGRLITGGSQLLVCYDGAPANGAADWAAPDTVCLFSVQGDQLTRTNQNTGASYVVASHVSQMQLTDQGDGIRIELTFAYRDVTRTYTLISRDP